MRHTSFANTPRPLNQVPLSIGTESVSQSLARRIPGREREWARDLAHSLGYAESALAQHVAALEEPEGEFAGGARQAGCQPCRSQRDTSRLCAKRASLKQSSGGFNFSDSDRAREQQTHSSSALVNS